MVSPLLGNLQIVQGCVLCTSVRLLTINVSASVSPGFSAAAVSGGRVSGRLVGKTKTIAETKTVLQSSLMKAPHQSLT